MCMIEIYLSVRPTITIPEDQYWLRAASDQIEVQVADRWDFI